VDSLLADLVTRLTAAGARDEVLVDFSRPRWAGLKLAPRMVEVERVWRLGVLLLGHSARLYATGITLHVTEPKHPNPQSLLAEERRMLRTAAAKAGIPKGETIDLDARDIRLDELTADSRPIARTADGFGVQWSPASPTLTPLQAYLEERVALLIEPPEGA
jgi:hypothetical protein